MADQYVYILSDHEDYGAEHVTATPDRGRLEAMIDENWSDDNFPKDLADRRRQFREEAKAALAEALYRTDEELAAECGIGSISLHGGIYGGMQLHVVKLVKAGKTTAAEPDIVEIAGRKWTIDRIYLDTSGVPLYGCGSLPLRNRREDLIRDIELAQGPEWRR